VTGGCLCGAVTWSTAAELRDVLECHCHRCQRITGNHMAATAAPTAELAVAGDALRWYSPTDDDNVAYGFCAVCGSSLFYRSGVADGTNAVTSICAGSIDGPSGLRTSAVWFAADAADHVRLDPDTPSFPTHP
jgi:hypothetical protein